MSRALMKKTQDNISTVMVSFRDFVRVREETLKEEELQEKLARVLRISGGSFGGGFGRSK